MIEETALGLVLRRNIDGKEQRLLVMSDADFMSTATLDSDTAKINGRFLEDAMRWLSNGTHPVDTTRPGPIDTRTSLDLQEVGVLRMLLLGGIPIAIFLSGASLLIYRRRR